MNAGTMIDCGLCNKELLHDILMSRVDQSILVNLLLFTEHGYSLFYVINHNVMTSNLPLANLCFMSSAAKQKNMTQKTTKRNMQHFWPVVFLQCRALEWHAC